MASVAIFLFWIFTNQSRSSTSPEPLEINEITETSETITQTADLPSLTSSTTAIITGSQLYSATARLSQQLETRYIDGHQASSSRLIPMPGGAVNLRVVGGSATTPSSLNLALPYVLPTNNSYAIDFDVKILPTTNYGSWVRLMTNYTENKGYYLISFFPINQSFELSVNNSLDPSKNRVYRGSNVAINKDSEINRIRIARNPVNGILEVFANGTSILKIRDLSFIGGTNKFSFTTYTSQSEAQYKNFKIFTVTSALN